MPHGLLVAGGEHAGHLPWGTQDSCNLELPMASLNLPETAGWSVLPLCLPPLFLHSGPTLHQPDGSPGLPQFLSQVVSLMELLHT